MEESKSNWDVEAQMIAANSSTVRNCVTIKYKDAKAEMIYYSAKNTILVYSYKQHRILNCLNGHTGRVNGVEILDTEETTALCTVDSDKTIIIWSSNNVEELDWNKQIINNAHDVEINMVTSTRFKNFIYVATFCLNGELKIWKTSELTIKEDIHHCNLKLLTTLHFGTNLQESFKMFPLNERYIMLLIGGFDKFVHVYTIDSQSTSEDTVEYHTSLMGHSDSIRDYCVTQAHENDLRYIFSCSQDCLIRVWKLCKITSSQAKEVEETEEDINELPEDEFAVENLKTKTSYVLYMKDDTIYNITLSSVLQNHSQSVSSVRLCEEDCKENDPLHSLTLLSSSFDFTCCIWKVDQDSGVWVVETTLGEMSGNKHAYFGAEFLEKDKIFAYTFNGAFHRWDYEESSWRPKPCITGHFDVVPDLDWDPSRNYLVTTSKDQTTRVYSFCKKYLRWLEISRPQVHGYDINCIAFLRSIQDNANSDIKYAPHIISGADEKILRVFDPPFSFIKSANKYCENNLRFTKELTNEEIEQRIKGKQAEVASMTLGLMNKPILSKKNLRIDDEENPGVTVEDFEPDVLTNKKDAGEEIFEYNSDDLMITEEYLMSKTRWPERNKLYGHVYEIYCVATTKKGDYIVTAAQSKKKKYSGIFVWTLASLNPICQLVVHEFTIHQLEFSPDDNYLLSVSRDRQFSVFERSNDAKEPFKLIQLQNQAHKRVLLCCSWAHNSKYFATGSKDKTNSLKFWDFSQSESKWIEHSSVAKSISNVTALAFFPYYIQKQASLGIVVGQETGEITIWTKPESLDAKEWTKIYSFPEYYNHSMIIRRIKFKEISQIEDETYHIATCGDDSTSRIFRIKVGV